MTLLWRYAYVLLFSVYGMAQTAPAAGELRVRVQDPSGMAVGVSGTVESLSTHLRRNFKTGNDGTRTISPLPTGQYRVRVSKEGFATHTAIVEIAAEGAVEHNVRLAIGNSAYAVSVVSTTPLAGLDRVVEDIPAPTQTATDRDLDASGALDISAFLNRRLNNVYVNEIQGNPMQPDVNYRGYTASPLTGTPQGMSIYLDGVRMNQPFGDVVSWDLIPKIAISEMALIPGSNPLFGLNTLGGSLSLRSKDGISHAGTSVTLTGGSFGRKMADFEHGGSTNKGLHWFLASSFFFEDGWRETSPSNVRQFFGKIGSQKERTSVQLSASYANNALIGNGLQERRLLDRDYHSVYTKPDVNPNRSPMLNLSVRRTLTPALSFSANAYFRYLRTHAFNGDINEASLDQSVYQPSAAERNALAAAGFTGFPASGATAANTPFPFWRCLGNVLLRDEPGEKCNGLLNRTGTQQRNYGAAGQLTWYGQLHGHRNQFTVGAAYDGNNASFLQSTELGYLNPDRSITGTGAYADGVHGGNVDGEPFDTRVDLNGRIHSASFYLTDTLTLDRLSLTVSGRFNRTSINNLDRVRPRAGAGSLTGQHDFNRLNPAAGATYRMTGQLSIYGGFTEGNRAPTSVELGCADPNTPCKLPNAMAGDPPLEPVVTRTFEAGLRGGQEARLHWSAGWFHATNRNDILFVASEQTGFGYFRNFDQTRRQGLELSLNSQLGRVTLGGGYTFLDATFQSHELVNGTGNSTNLSARRGVPGLESTIEITPGNRIPLVPQHLAKAFADVQLTTKAQLDFSVVGISSSYARGNENNSHQPDGRYYLDAGSSPAYAVTNLGARYQVHPRVQLSVQVNNLLNTRYYTGAQLGPTGFTANGAYVARPFAAINGEFPVQQATFYAPGAPRGAWVGLRWRF